MKKIRRKTLHPAHILTGLAIGIIIGMIMAVVLKVNSFASGWWLFLAVLLSTYAFIWPSRCFVVIIICIGGLLSFWRASSVMIDRQTILNLVGKEVLISGTVTEDVERGQSDMKVKLENPKIAEQELEGTIYAQIVSKADIQRGDEIELKGVLASGFGSYIAALWRPEVLSIKRAADGDPLIAARDNFAEAIGVQIPEEEASLGLSYLLGMKSGLSSEITEMLQMIGLTHVVVASGTHLSILVGFTKKIFGRISRLMGVISATLFVLLFATMIGWTASITRAALVAILTLIVGYTGRKFQPWRLILIVMATTLMINPMNLTQLGWLLSFGSYAGIMLLAPKLTAFCYGEKKPGRLAETLIASVAAMVLCLPLQIYFFGSFSLLSLLANLIILPTMPYVMGMVFATGLGGTLWAPLGWGLGKLATLMLKFHLCIMGFLAEQKLFLVELPPGCPEIFWSYAVLLVPMLIWGRQRLILAWKKSVPYAKRNWQSSLPPRDELKVKAHYEN